MKTKSRSLLYFLVLVLFPAFVNAQSLEVHKLLGQNTSAVIKQYGNPVHKDASNPDMICMFYQNKTMSMIFVSGKQGVYQAEATKIFNSETDAKSNIDSFVSNSITDGFVVDTISTSDFQLRKSGANVDLQLSENKISKNFEVKVKARKTEG